jgi:hypothetical protein
LLHPLLERCICRHGRQDLGLLVELGRQILTSRHARVKPRAPLGGMRP